MRYLNRAGDVVTREQWLSNGYPYTIERDTVRGVTVSTVWMGLEVSADGVKVSTARFVSHTGPSFLDLPAGAEPVGFETVVYETARSPVDPWCRFEWSTEAEARRGHTAVLKVVQNVAAGGDL